MWKVKEVHELHYRAEFEDRKDACSELMRKYARFLFLDTTRCSLLSHFRPLFSHLCAPSVYMNIDETYRM
jgi:hypothetical protein